MAESAVLKIVVRAVDATKSVLAGIGGRIVSVLLKPLGLVTNAVRGIVKQFFSLKSLLLGGGIIGVAASAISSLAKNARDYQAVFDSRTQSRIDATAEAFDKLGTSLKVTFANILTSFEIDKHLNALSDWLRDHQAEIIKFFTDFGNTMRDAWKAASDLVAKIKELGAARSESDTIKAAADYYRQRTLSGQTFPGAASAAGAGPGAEINPFYPLLTEPNVLTTSRPTSRPDSRPSSRPSSRGVPAWATALQTAPVESFTAAIESAAKAQELASTAWHDATVQGAALSAAYDDTAKAAAFHASIVEATAPKIRESIIAIDELADTIAGNFTDAFLDAIEGTKTFARAFGDMTISIIRDIGRLLVFRSIFGLVAGELSPSIGGGNAGNFGGSDLAPFEPPFAGGGPVRRSGVASVGEQGRERVFLPRGARVEPAHFRGGSSGLTVNVIGARDARATATEVIAELRRNGALRAAVRLA